MVATSMSNGNHYHSQQPAFLSQHPVMSQYDKYQQSQKPAKESFYDIPNKFRYFGEGYYY